MPDGIARSLRRLRGLHLRLSLCRVSLTPGCDSRLAAVDDGSLIAELADDGSLIVIFIHPQDVTDEDAASGLCTRLEPLLRQGAIPLGALKIAILACDAAAIDDSDIMLDTLESLPGRPLLRVAAPASPSPETVA